MAIKNHRTISTLISRILLLAFALLPLYTKSNPKTTPSRSIVFKRAQSLNNGVSVSWLEQTWNNNILDTVELKDADFKLLKKLGFKSIRLPVAFAYFESKGTPLEKALAHVDEVVKQCNQYGFKLIIDYHAGNLNDGNYLTETPRIINLWQILTKRYINQGADNLFFELYNEPPHMDPQIWKDAIYNIVTAVRKIDKNRTLIVGASNFDSIYELSRFVRLADDNIIYTFHFYEPFFFTHQGAEWIGDQVATTGVSFPYNGENFPKLNPRAKNTWGETNYYQYQRDGNQQSLKDKLQIVKNWGNKYDVPILCGEYGVYNKYADQDSRCRYIKAMRNTLKALNIPGIMWDYNSNFSIFNGPPSMADLPDCMREAIGYNAAK
ncbi:glycoside hydrolase family 5 protein [Mucilaginibacter sp.]